MLNPADCTKGNENYEKFSTTIGRKKASRIQYDYRHNDGELFSCVGNTVEACRKKRDEWLKKKQFKEDYTLIAKIAERSEKMNIGFGNRISRLMDIEFAHEKFNLRLTDFLNTDDLNFAHDFNGIQSRIDRRATKWIDDCFVPRFAGNQSGSPA